MGWGKGGGEGREGREGGDGGREERKGRRGKGGEGREGRGGRGRSIASHEAAYCKVESSTCKIRDTRVLCVAWDGLRGVGSNRVLPWHLRKWAWQGREGGIYRYIKYTQH